MFHRHADGSNFSDVGRFHELFQLDNVSFRPVGPREVDSKFLEFRFNFLLEELKELMDATGAHFISHNGEAEDIEICMCDGLVVNHPKAFDALIDLVYVAMGTAHFLGYPWQEGWDRVQDANMKKVRAQADASDSLRNSSFDVVKPPGWEAPDLGQLLAECGWPNQETPE